MNPEQWRWYINHFGILLMPWVSAGLGVLFISVTPIGRAIIDRLRAGGRAQREALRAELEALRRHLGDVDERLDFAERALTQQRATGLPPAPSLPVKLPGALPGAAASPIRHSSS